MYRINEEPYCVVQILVVSTVTRLD